MADPLGTIASIIALLQTAKAAYDNVQNATHLPQVFGKIHGRITLATETLVEVQQRYQTNTQDEAKIRGTLQGCEKDAKELKEIYEAVCAAAKADRQQRYRSYVSNLIHDRKSKVEEVWRSLLEGLEVLRGYHLFRALPLPDLTPKPVNALLEAAASIIPFRRDADFVERGDLLDRIGMKLSQPAGRVALVGLGGVGKSQLAIEYCYRAREQSPETWILWIYAGSRTRYEQGIREIATVAQIAGRDRAEGNILQLVRDWLLMSKKKWILVLDNVDDASFLVERRTVANAGDRSEGQDRGSLFELLPVCDRGSILITSRTEREALKVVERSDIISIDPMDRETAIALLERKLGKQEDESAVADLIETLEYFPLAITQAAAYINQKGRRSSVRHYLEKLQDSDRSKRSILDIDGGDLRRDGDAHNSIMRTWQISFEHVRQIRPSAADLLALMCFCDRQSIPEDLLRRRGFKKYGRGGQEDGWQTRKDEGDEENDSDQASLTSSDTETDDGFDDDLAMLEDYSFVSVATTASVFQMHRLVQLATRRWLESQNELERWKEQYIYNLDATMPALQSQDHVARRVMFPQLKLALDLKPKRGGRVLLVWARLMYIAAEYAVGGGNVCEAEKMAEECLKARRTQLKDNDRLILMAMAIVAQARKLMGRYAEAMELLLELLEGHQKALEADSESDMMSTAEYCMVMLELASTLPLHEYGLGEEAVGLSVVEVMKKIYAEEHADTLTAMNTLARTYRKQERLKEAEELQTEVLQTQAKVLGENHPRTLTSRYDLGVTYRAQGRLAEAEELQTKVLQTQMKLLGDCHPDTVAVRCHLAVTYRAQGRLAETEELLTKLLEIRVKILGHCHPDTLTTRSNLALMYGEQGRLAEAEELQAEVLEMSKNVQGAEHRDTLTAMHNLACTLRNQGRNGAAYALMSDCALLSVRVIGAEHSYTVGRNEMLKQWTQK